MARILYITSNPKTIDQSTSLKLGKEFMEAYQLENENDEIIVIDLFQTRIPELDAELLNFRNGMPETNPEVLAKTQQISHLVDQFVLADKYVFVTPLWNLGFPPRMKLYIDSICMAGKTFKYSPTGPKGLLENKKCLHIHSSGGFHSKDPMNHADGYLRDILSFMGVRDYNTLLVEGYQAVPERSESILSAAYAQIPTMVQWFS